MFGINGGELVVLLVVIGLVVGPQRLPQYAEQLAHLVRGGRKLLADARSRVETELGEQGADVDWANLDPRRYDPRRIVRDALLDETGSGTGARPGPPGSAVTAGGASVAAFATGAPRLAAGELAPFDVDAT